MNDKIIIIYNYIQIAAMSMSTKIDDLPGPLPDDVKNDIHLLQGEMKINVPSNENNNKQNVIDITNQQKLQNLQVDNNTNITLDIKKKPNTQEQQKDEGILTILKNEINEDNLLLCVIIFMGTYQPLTQYVQKLPIIGNYASGNIMTGLIKTLLLILIYIIAKIYILPRIRI